MDATLKKLWYLEKFNFFSEVTPEQKQFVRAHVIMRTINKGSIIYFQEDTTRTVYFLKEGRVKLVNSDAAGNEMIIAIINAGEIFG